MKLKITAWISLALVLHYCFFENRLGLNIVVCTSLCLISLFAFNDFVAKNKIAYALVFASALPSLYNPTITGFLVSIFGIITLVGLETESVKQAIFGLISGLSKIVVVQLFGKKPTDELSDETVIEGPKPKSKIKLSYIITPFFVSIVFITLYAGGIPLFGEILSAIGTEISIFFEELYSSLSIASISLLLLILVLTSFLFIHYKTPWIAEIEAETPLYISRKKHKVSALSILLESIGFIPKIGNLALKHEHKIAAILVATLNALISIVLVVGIYGAIFPEINAEKAPHEILHEGTNSLIFSLLIGAGLVIYFYRGNQNFYTNTVYLKPLSKIWLGQNALLAVLVAFYNFQYISEYGLTYKRIGVYFFLFLTFIGLIVVFLKLNKRYSTFFLAKTGLYVGFGFTALVSPVNWDGLIVNHNLSRNDKSTILSYTLDLSPRSIPYLVEKTELYNYNIGPGNYTFSEVLVHKIREFKNPEKDNIMGTSYIDKQIKNSIQTFEKTIGYEIY